MSFAPGMENAFIQSEIDDKINNLEADLWQLCYDYLRGCNSLYSICLYRIFPPESSFLAQSVTLKEGIQDFVSKMMNDWAIVNNNMSNYIRNIGVVPPTQEDLMRIFTTPILEMLQSLQASFYLLTDDGEIFYDDLLKPSVESICTAAIRINDFWFILMAEWSD